MQTATMSSLMGRQSSRLTNQPARAHTRLQVKRSPRCVVQNISTQERSAPAGSAEANQLEALKQVSKVVADTGEIQSIVEFQPVDCTTNPSLVLKAVQQEQYQHFLSEALAIEKQTGTLQDPNRPYVNVADILAVNIGAELLDIVPGRVSTEVDAHLSYDTNATVDKALRIVDLYAKKGIDTSRIYIKIAATWQGIRACEILQKQGIDTNMTLLFSFAQAGACADSGAALISPFVGRIMDWYKKKEGRDFAPHEDPGVLSVQKIYKYYKEYKYPTIVMAASFRNVGEITELAGCDNITIAPALLKQLAASTDPLPRKLYPGMGASGESKLDLSGSNVALYDELHLADQMAVDKLAEGVENFAADQKKLEGLLQALAEKA